MIDKSSKNKVSQKEENCLNLGEKYKNLRETKINKDGKPFSLRALAEAMGEPTYYGTIASIERGDKEPSIADIKKYYNYFKNVSLEYLSGLSDVKQYKNKENSNRLGLSDEVLNQLKKLKKHNEQKVLDTINIILRDKRLLEELHSYIFFTSAQTSTVKFDDYTIDYSELEDILLLKITNQLKSLKSRYSSKIKKNNKKRVNSEKHYEK